MTREKQFIEDQEIRNEMDLYLKSFNYNDGQRKTIINLCEPGNLEETDNGIDWSNELINVLHEWDDVIGRPPYKAPSYKGISEDKTAPKPKSRGQYLPGGRGRSLVKTNVKSSEYFSTAWERRENGKQKANERERDEKRRKAVKGLF